MKKSLGMKADGCRRGASHGFHSCSHAVHAEPLAKVAWSPRVTFYLIDQLIDKTYVAGKDKNLRYLD